MLQEPFQLILVITLCIDHEKTGNFLKSNRALEQNELKQSLK
jgi:hypothetical protein